jgi:molecular chaperone GrpE (heat shock protein)
VGFSEATTGNGKVVRVGFADAPLTDAEYKERYQQLATEFDSFKRAHEKEVKELRDQLAKYVGVRVE